MEAINHLLVAEVCSGGDIRKGNTPTTGIEVTGLLQLCLAIIKICFRIKCINGVSEFTHFHVKLVPWYAS